MIILKMYMSIIPSDAVALRRQEHKKKKEFYLYRVSGGYL